MIFIPEHKITFESDDDIVLYPIVNPTYVYKIGDKIRVIDTKDDTEVDISEIEVVDVEQEIINLAGEQNIIVYIKKIKEVKEETKNEG